LIQRSAIPRRRGPGCVQKDDRSAHNLWPRGSLLASAVDPAQPGSTYLMPPFLKFDVCKFIFDPQFSQYEDHSLCACGMERAIQHHSHFYAISEV
jgi:hypothetical protein